MSESLIDTDAPEKEEENPDPWHRSDEDILSEARTRRKACDEAEGDNRIKAVADLKFLEGGTNQWDDIAVASRTADKRPIITVNSMPTYLHQVTNDQRLNTPALKVHPVGAGAKQEVAKVRQGLIRHIEYESNADVARDTAVNSAAAVGFGYFRLITDYESESSFNQKIMFRRIRNALSVRIDPLSVEPDGSDQKYAFVELKMAKDAFKRQWPDAEASATSIFNDDPSYEDWLTDTEVLVCDYYAIETREAEVVLLSNGESGFKEDLLEMPPGVTIEKTRKGERSRTMLYKITGVDILDRSEIKCKWIPVFPVYGDEIDIEGKITRSGIIRNAKGPAQMYNVMMTGATEEVLLRSKVPYIGAEGQFEGYEDQWAQANVRAFPFLEYKPVTLDGQLAPPPQRSPMADVPTGMIALAMHAKDNVKATTGLFDASLGAKGTATSGKQELAQQREGDVANYHYQDGLLRTNLHCGRCLNYMLPFYYDTERTVCILGEDDKAGYVVINDAEGALSMKEGEFGVTISNGPSFSTQRQENAEFFANAMSSAKDPGTAAVLGYLAIRNQDIAGGEVATKMLETLLPPPAKAVLDEEKGGDEDGEEEPMVQTSQGPVPLSQIPQLLDQLQQQMAAMNEALEKSDAAKKQTELLKQQQLMREQELEPMRLQNEQAKVAAEGEKAAAARIQAEADRIRAQAEAEMAPQTAHAAAVKAETDNVTAHVNLLNAQKKAQVDAARAQAEVLQGDAPALQVFLATLEADTEIQVAEIMARSRERVASMKPKPKEKT